MNKSLTIPIAIFLGGVMVAAAVYFTSAPTQEPSTSSGTGNPTLVTPVGPSDHILGNPAAPVKIIEYSDFSCEYCKAFNATMHQIIANEGTTGKVAWVFREFPLTEIHPNALAQAQAAECVAKTSGEQAFWNFEDALFQNQPVDPSHFGALAQKAGVTNSNALGDCLANASSTVNAQIMAERQNAIDIGARGTPYSVLLAPGQAPVVMDGAYSYDAVKQLIDQALGTAG